LIRRLVAPALVVLAIAAPALAAPDAACPKCARPGQPGWKFCPYDGFALVDADARHDAAPATPTAASRPAPLGATSAPASAPKLEVRENQNPYDAVEDLFRAITVGDEAAIRKLYRWEAFFQDLSLGARQEKIAEYIDRLMKRVGPTLKGRQRYPADIKILGDEADFRVELRQSGSRDAVAAYDFRLTRGPDGWKIVSIRP
jgi:hypothetical protein